MQRFMDDAGCVSVTELINFWEEELLKFETFPEEYFEFVAAGFSDETFLQSKDVWKILHFLATENLSVEQDEQLSSLLVSKFLDYDDYMLCDMTCDFVARKCHPKKSLEKLTAMSHSDLDDIHRAALLSGLTMLRSRSGVDANTIKSAESLTEKIGNSEQD